MLTGKLENRFSIGDNAMVPSMAYSPDGKLLALDGGSPEDEIMVWDLESDSLKYTLSHGSIGDARIQFGPDSSILYSLDDSVGQAGIKAWDLDKGDQLRFEVHASHLKTFARTFDLSPDGESIAVGYQDGSFAVLDSSSLRPLFRRSGTTGQWPRLSIVRTAISWRPSAKPVIARRASFDYGIPGPV